MKKVFKKAVSLLLCAALLATSFGVGGVFSSASAEIASSQTDEFYELTIMTKCFYTDEYGELVETETVLPGENVKFRVYVGTNYVSTNSTFMFFFDPNVFADSNPYNTEFNLHVNPAIDSVVKEAIAFKFDSRNARLQYLVSEGYIDAEYVDSHDAYAVQLMLESVPGYIQYDADEWLFEFDMIATENIDVIGSLEVHQGSLLSPETPRGFIDVPVVTDTEQPQETSLPLYLVEVSACLDFCNIIVKDSVPVTFHANGGRFNDGSEIQFSEIPYNCRISASDVEIPTRDGYIFDGWFDESGEYRIESLSCDVRTGMEIYAGWVGEEFNLILDANGGEFYDGNTRLACAIPYGEPINYFVDEPTKVGCKFAGWKNSETEEIYYDLSICMPQKDLYLEAVWEYYLYAAVYNANSGYFADGTNEIYIEHMYGDMLLPPEEPERVGYTFIGWTQEEGSDILVDIESMTMPIDGISFYAVFVPCEDTAYTVNTYMMNTEGIYELTETVLYAETTENNVEYLPPEIEGFTVNEEYSRLAGVVQGDGSLLLEVYYDRNKYSIVLNNTYEIVSNEYYYGSEIVEPEIPIRPGYVFDGWVDREGNYVQFPYEMPSYSVTFTAVFSACEYNVYYDLEGGCFPDGEYIRTEIYEYGAEVYCPAYPVKEGYTFVGWADGETGKEIILPFVMPEYDVILKAEWAANEYEIIFDDGYGNEIDVHHAEYGIEISQIVYEAQIPTRYGYTFSRWFNETTGEYFEEGMIMPAHEIRFVPVWTANEYAATFISDGVTVYEDRYLFDSVVELPEGLYKTGYTFEGWADGEGRIYSAGDDYIMLGEDVTFTAVYIAGTDTPYTVEVYIMETDGCYPDEASEAYLFVGDTDCVVTVPEEHFLRDGFYLDMGNSVLEGIIMADGSTVLKVYLERISYTLDVDIDGNIESTEYYYGSIVTEPEYPEKVGFYFDSWVDENGEKMNFPFEMPAEDVTINAAWIAAEYTVTFDAGEGRFSDGYYRNEYTYCYGEEIISPEDPIREGYVFAGWKPSIPDYMPANNMEFTAVWEALGSVTYTVETYVMNTSGEYNLSTTYHTAEQSGEVSVSPVISEGFELNSDLSVLEGYAYPENELVLKIYIDRQSFTFTKIIDGISYATEYLYGSIIAEPETPVKDGYNFIGWDSVIPSTMPTNDVTITAIFEVAEPEDIYNLGEETYSFRNFVDSDSSGHCFGMSSTSAGYHIGELAIEEINGSEVSDLYTLSRTETVQAPICKYQAIQGSYSLYSTVAGGRYYKTKKYNISSDWEAVVNYVKNHEYDDKGTLQIGYRKDGRGGHAVNFLRYEEVDGQARIYAYDNNFPTKETYFYMDENGDVLQAPSSTFKAPIDCIALRSIPEYFNLANDFDTTRCIYADRDTIVVSGASEYSIDGNIENSDVELCEKVVFEIPAGVEQVTITSLVDNASFTYLGEEYSFGKDDNNVGVLILASSEEGGANDNSAFEITNGTANISICTPSVTNINYGDRIILYADVSNIPEGGYVKWSASNRNFSYTVSSNGAACVITPSSSGDTTFTATICDAKGNVVSSDNQTMTAKAGFFDKIIAFFKKIFGSTKIIVQNIDD